MRAAIIGLPQSGKTTVFEAVTGRAGAPGEPGRERLAMVQVPDDRLETLAAIYKPKKVTQAAFEFVDVPGLSLRDAHGQEEMRRHLPAIRQADVLVAVIRDFEDPAVPAYRDRVDRDADLIELWEEFLFADLDTVTHRVEKLEKA
ncbi:MAG: GTPase, partial [Phycisphaerae bacterium]